MRNAFTTALDAFASFTPDDRAPPRDAPVRQTLLSTLLWLSDDSGLHQDWLTSEFTARFRS